jgi:hypothetical protein
VSGTCEALLQASAYTTRDFNCPILDPILLWK